jgi:hypothetical protein
MSSAMAISNRGPEPPASRVPWPTPSVPGWGLRWVLGEQREVLQVLTMGDGLKDALGQGDSLDRSL